MDNTGGARRTAKYNGELVVFLIGMRINKPWKIHKWLPAVLAFRRILQELDTGPECGFLGHNGYSGRMMVQYWQSFDCLEAYARNQTLGHWPAWIAFNHRMKSGRGDVGVWHETYLIAPGRYEAIYIDMPEFGLGKVGETVSAEGNRGSARHRLRTNSNCEQSEPEADNVA